MFGNKKTKGKEEEKKNVPENMLPSEAPLDKAVESEVKTSEATQEKSPKLKSKKDAPSVLDSQKIPELKVAPLPEKLTAEREKPAKTKKGLFGFLKKNKEDAPQNKPLSSLPDDGPIVVIGPEESKKKEQSDPLLFLTPKTTDESAVIEQITQSIPKNAKPSRGKKSGGDDLVQTILASAIDSNKSASEAASGGVMPSEGSGTGLSLVLEKAPLAGGIGERKTGNDEPKKIIAFPPKDGKSESNLLLSLEDEIKHAKIPPKQQDDVVQPGEKAVLEPMPSPVPIVVKKKGMFGFLKKKEKTAVPPALPDVPVQIPLSPAPVSPAGADKSEEKVQGNAEVVSLGPVGEVPVVQDDEKPIRNPVALYRDLGIPDEAPSLQESEAEPVLGLKEKLATNKDPVPLEQKKSDDGNQLVSAIIATAKKSQDDKNKVLGADFSDQIKKEEDIEEEKKKEKERKKAKHLLASRFMAGVSLIVPLCSWIVFSSLLTPDSSFSAVLNAKNYGAELKGTEAKKASRDADLKKITDEINKLKQDTDNIKDNKILKEVLEKRVDFLEIMLRINKITLKALNLTPELNSAIHMLVFNSYNGKAGPNGGDVQISIAGSVHDPKRLSMSKVTQIIESINSDEYLDGAALRSFSKTDDEEGGTVSSFNLTITYSPDAGKTAATIPDPAAKKKAKKSID